MATEKQLESGVLPDSGHEQHSSQSTSASVSEPAKTKHQDLEPAPDGGLEAWLVAVGASSIFFSCLGFSNSFGVFADYYPRNQLYENTPDQIAWIGSVSPTLQFLTGLIAGPLFDRYGVILLRPAAIIYLFAIMMLSLCHTYWQIMLVQGVLMGIVQGMMQFPAMGAVVQFFDKNRGAALGVAISGSSIGGIVMPILVSNLLNETTLGFGWSIRIMGFIMVPFLLLAIFTIKTRVPPRTTSFFIPAAFKDIPLMALSVSIFFTFMGLFTPLFFLPTYAANSRHMNETMAGYLLAILNGASTFGRVIPGIFADKYGRFNVYCFGTIATGIVICFFNFPESTGSLVAYSIIIGFTSGTIISGASTALASCCKNVQDIGTYSGLGFAIGSLGGLIGPPLNGVFIRNYASYFQSGIFSGMICILGGFIGMFAKSQLPGGLLGRG